ncbi:MAG: hypothetical protein EOO40_08895 [Deltaproteobacteria bacterium]|nr:MAG: hypothetical protein EOO40_08895 [Deltaproteobacteria bacterium]
MVTASALAQTYHLATAATPKPDARRLTARRAAGLRHAAGRRQLAVRAGLDPEVLGGLTTASALVRDSSIWGGGAAAAFNTAVALRRGLPPTLQNIGTCSAIGFVGGAVPGTLIGGAAGSLWLAGLPLHEANLGGIVIGGLLYAVLRRALLPRP